VGPPGGSTERASTGSPSASAADLREVPCYFCGRHDEHLRFVDGDYRVVDCTHCGLVYVTPRLPPERLHEMYQSEYWESDRAKEFGYTEYLADRELYERTYRRRTRTIGRYRTDPGHVLDVGCAAGFFLNVMREQGWTTAGLEISQPMVEYAQQTLELPDVRRGDLLGVEVEPDSVDLLTLWDVIEHMEDPRAHLQAAHRALRSDGLLVLETQNVGSRFAKLLGRKWQHYKHEEHLFHFDPATVERLLEESGFEVLENTPRHGGKYVSLDFLVERVGRIHPILSVLASPLRLVGGTSLYLNFQDEMVVVARPR